MKPEDWTDEEWAEYAFCMAQARDMTVMVIGNRMNQHGYDLWMDEAKKVVEKVNQRLNKE